MSTRENAILDALRGVLDPLDQAKACQEFLTNGATTMKKVRALRDDAIRRGKTPGRTVDEIASKVSCGRSTVVNALRPRATANG